MSQTQWPAAPEAPLAEQQPPTPMPSNGLATASLVCGVIAVIGGIVPLLNLVSGLVAIPAIVLGFLGLAKARRFAGSKKMSVAGIVTGAVGLVLTVVTLALVGSAISDVADSAADGKKVAPATSSAPAGSAAAGNGTAILGKDTVKMSNGLEVTPGAPKKYTPSDYVSDAGADNFKVEVAFKNTGSKDVDLGLASLKASSDGGATKSLFDTAKNVGGYDGGTLAPGQSTTMTFGFSTEKAPSYVNVDVVPGLVAKAHFTYRF